MAQPRPSLQQRLFADDELALPLHDQIVRWVDKALKNKPSAILKALQIDHREGGDGLCYAWGDPIYENNIPEYLTILERAAKRIMISLKPSIPDALPVLCSDVRWETILKDDRSVIVGAVDLSAMIILRRPVLTCVAERIGSTANEAEWILPLLENGESSLIAVPSKVWVSSKPESIRGLSPTIPDNFVGLIADKAQIFGIRSIQWSAPSWANKQFRILVEAKTKIKTAGELLRQINLYRSVVGGSAQFLVVAPAMAWEPDLREILNEQGIATLIHMAN